MENKEWINSLKKDLFDTLKSHIDMLTLTHFEVKDFDMSQEYICLTDEINHLIDTEELRINKKAGIKILKNNEWLSINETYVLIAPMIVKTNESYTYSKDPNSEIPFWYFAKVDRSGNLDIPDETFPLFQQELIEYLIEQSTDFSLEKLEHALSQKAAEKKEFKDYEEYINYLQELYRYITGQNIGSHRSSSYSVINTAIVLLPHQDILMLLKLIHFVEDIKP